MRLRPLLVPALLACCAVATAAPPDDLEARALAAAGAGDEAGLAEVASRLAALPPAERGARGFRLRAREVELRFAGRYLAGFCLPGSLEWVAAWEGERDHEALVALPRAERPRLAALRSALDGLRARGAAPRLRLEVSWLERDGTPRREDLRDVVRADPARFEAHLRVQPDDGIGATHVAADPAALPAGPTEIRLAVVVTW